MTIKAVNLSKTINYQSDNDADKGSQNATTFVLGALDARVVSSIKDKATAIPVSSLGTGEGFATLRINEMNFDVVQFGLKNLVNFTDSDGNQIAYNTVVRQLGGKNYTVCDPAIVEAIPEEEIAPMADAILNINSLSETERKN
jgi:hypothetical protein